SRQKQSFTGLLKRRPILRVPPRLTLKQSQRSKTKRGTLNSLARRASVKKRSSEQPLSLLPATKRQFCAFQPTMKRYFHSSERAMHHVFLQMQRGRSLREVARAGKLFRNSSPISRIRRRQPETGRAAWKVWQIESRLLTVWTHKLPMT